MLLVIDVGNTNTVIGVFENNRVKEDWRIKSIRDMTPDEFNITAKALFRDAGIDPEKIEKVVISSVVPPALAILDKFCRKYLNIEPLWVTPQAARSLMPILYHNPAEVGSDRIVNAVAAYDKYRTGLIIVDFGTATTFDVISENGEYLGGAITPGVAVSSEALFRKASKLPRVEIFQPPEKVIGKDTSDSIKSGIIYGYAALVDGMVERMRDETGGHLRAVATGGLSPLISKVSRTIENVEERLTLEGLRIISERLSAR
ncbi:MAG: type III pantothenate kinase [Desulfarculaceae bacterium]|nr:type III pantothenate kinase [Desulfarculaceae bacterium]